MTQELAMRRLHHLANSAELLRHSFAIGDRITDLTQMKFEAAAILASHLGSDHFIVVKLNDLKVGHDLVAVSALGQDSSANEFVGLVRAGINLVGANSGRPAQAPPICDPDLWRHIEELVTIEAWPKIPAAVVTFVEDWYRKSGKNPRTKSGAKLVGSDLFNRVMSEKVLGDQESEREGWRALGRGLTQAIGNLHRHNIEQRPDAKQLAWGVIGLGSLLIGEMKFTHPE